MVRTFLTVIDMSMCKKLVALLLILYAPTTSHAQSPSGLLNGLLPSPATSSPPAKPTPQQEIIPLAKPDDEGEIIVEEAGEGLISLKVRDASLKQVVAMIAETQRFNVVFAAAEDFKISGSLDRVHWRQALETVIASSGHTWTDDRGILVVTSLDAAESIAPRAGGRRVETFELDFAKATDVEQTVQGLLSPAGKAWVTQASSTDNRQSREVVAVIDFPGNLAQIADYICQIDQPPRQVLIKANILEIDLKDDCRSGVNLQQLVNISGNQLNFSSIGFADGLAGAATTLNPNPVNNTSFLQLTGGSLDGLVELLKETEDAKSLASTEILAIDGQLARLQSGQKIGFRGQTTTLQGGLQQQDVEFLEVGVVLSVTPHITRDGRVLMRVKPEVSEGFLVNELPNENTVEVETDILLNNGQGLVVGGLIREDDQNTQSKVPFLGDLPYAGILFQKRNIKKSRKEIIVTLIPHVMPYTPINIEHNDQRMLRTQQPVFSPPLNRFPRPYEPQLPDTFTNPRRLCIGRHCEVACPEPAESVVITPTPTLEVSQPASVQPADEQGPLCYPPAGIETPTLVPKQALRNRPTFR